MILGRVRQEPSKSLPDLGANGSKPLLCCLLHTLATPGAKARRRPRWHHARHTNIPIRVSFLQLVQEIPHTQETKLSSTVIIE